MDEGAGRSSSAAQREGQLHTDDDVHTDGDGGTRGTHKHGSGRMSAPASNVTG